MPYSDILNRIAAKMCKLISLSSVAIYTCDAWEVNTLPFLHRGNIMVTCGYPKSVVVRPYVRWRLGRWENVSSHCRSNKRG